MKEKLRKSGIDVIGDIPWGTHFCQFYQAKEDLIDVLVPYFKAGLENNEFCMWITSQPLEAEEAKEALREAIPDIDAYFEKGQIEIIPYTYWYVKEGVFDSKRVLNGWVEKLTQALASGFNGLRLSGNTFWLEKEDWNGFVEYEEEINNIISNYHMIALCTYSLDRCNSTEIIDVVINHQFALIKKEGEWEQIESSRSKKAEEAAVQATRHWEYTFDAMPDLIAILDCEYRIVRTNKAMAERLGTIPEKCTGLTCYSAVHGTGKPPSFCPHRQLLKDGLEHTAEVHEDCLGGCFLVSVSPIHDSKGNLIGSVHISRDINERKRAEEALIRRENEFRALAENSPDVIARFDRQNHHIYVNPAAAESYCHSQEEIIGKTHAELGMDPEKVKFWEGNNKKVFATGKPGTMEFKYTSPQGKEHYFNTRIVPEFVDGEVTSVLAISRDITDIKASEARLKEARDNLKRLVEKRTMKLRKAYRLLKENEKGLAEAQKKAHLGNWNWNIVTNMLYWSDEIYRIFGRTPQEFDATYDAFLGYIHPDDREYVNNAVKEALKGKAYSIDHRIIRESGEERIVHEQGEVIFDNENAPVRMMGIVQDITERKKTEKALELANAYNRSLIEASLDPLVTIGPDGKITDVNKATELVTGYLRNELIGTDFSDYFTEPEKAREGYEHVFREGLVRDYALEIQHRDGHITSVLYNASVYRDEDGEVIGIFAAARDVTELRNTERALKESLSFQETLLDAVPVPVFYKNKEGRYIGCNRLFANEVVGLPKEEIIGRTYSEITDNAPEELIKEYNNIDFQIYRDGTKHRTELKNRHLTKSLGKEFVITKVPFFNINGQIDGLIGALFDITEHKRAEKALKLANEYNRSLIEASVDPLVTIGPDGRITDVNNSTESVTGYSRKELIGTDFSDYFTEPEKAREGYQHVFQEGLVLDYPLEILHKDGHITPVLYNASVYRDEAGKVIGIFAAARDITERKKAERMLELKLEELARSNAELEQFAYVASHDLQEPLRMIASYLQLLQRKYQGKLDEKADKYIYFAVDGASRMQNLINDLLEFSRVTTKAREFEPTDCEFILNKVLSDLEISIIENEATISYDSLPEIMADGTQLAQVFQNLVSNAIKFRSKEAPKINISAEKEGDKWLFSVQDNGIGINSKYSERVFEVFKRLHKKEEYPGTGIGLSICKKIIERHGGDIWVESELGRGSTFYFTLPANLEKTT